MDITGASAIVTGGASGIGAAVARQLAAKGAKVVVADLNAEKGEALATEIGGAFVAVDVTDTEQIKAAIAKAVDLGDLRVLVNSAGIGWAQRTIGRDGTLESAANLDAFKKVVAINLIGSFDAIRIAEFNISAQPYFDAQLFKRSTRLGYQGLWECGEQLRTGFHQRNQCTPAVQFTVRRGQLDPG